MTHAEKAEIREIQRSIRKIAYEGSSHTYEELKALDEAVDQLEKAVEETT